MFGRLKRALKSFVDQIAQKAATKEISEKDLEDPLTELFYTLVESDVALPVAEKIIERIKANLVGKRVERRVDIEKIVEDAFKSVVTEVFSQEAPDLVEEARRIKPLKIVFLGVNGVGKTTTIAKIAYLAKEAGLRPLLVAADTFRAGAQEQLEEHARRVGVPIIKRRYGVDPAAVAYDAVAHAEAKKYDMVLIDTAGRMPTDPGLVDELRKIVRVTKPHYRVLVVDALTGNDAVEQARIFNEKVGVDLVVLTKVDADVKGGAALSVAYEIGKPIVYIGVGQSYKDLTRFSVEWLLNKILEK